MWDFSSRVVVCSLNLMSHLASSCVCCIEKVVTFMSTWTSYFFSRRKIV